MASTRQIRWTYKYFLSSAVLLLAMTLASPQRAAAAVANPTIIGPIPVTTTPGSGQTRNYPFYAAEPQFNLTLAGYREEEFFIEGKAASYDTPALADAILVSGAHNYRTSITVRRPSDPTKFNGIVLVEWVNVTAGYGIDVHWQKSREYLTREGYVHVGVQAQRVGVHQATTGLKDWSPTRYSTLDLTDGGTVTDDSLCYDVFSQAIQALKGPGKGQILGPLEPDAVLALGQSQSANRLTLYYNSVHPLHKVADGFLIQVGGGPFRTGIKEPLIQIMSEREIALTKAAAQRQPDSSSLRRWEIAGTSHVDYFWLMFRAGYSLRDGVSTPNLACTPEPASHVPLRYVLNSGYAHLTRWVLRGIPPPSAEPIVVTSTDPVVIPRDADGHVYGGIRQAAIDVPTATNRGDQPGITAGCPVLHGIHIPFSDAKLQQLYPTHDRYVQAVRHAVQKNVHDGFVLRDDAQEVITYARNSPVGTGRPVPIH